ncbi:protein translocase subunit SecD [Corynebacterium choanae]|uniref:Protein translocase subunit SecD n=1 Tax=Corynebacterium choanae TaxID=1862358 RepID=A0A3G6J9X7_9CORY|nr:protein translocase subunit SecD [Corynebacterium choanae]AZA13698.1 preprotein translocase subunit SecD [Corynebacterium choanae]
MASKSGRARVGQTKWPGKALALFALILVLIYALVLFTGGGKATPKLGIDLQGGTRVTLVPQGAEPTADQLEQAKRILQNRVNGMGVSGAEVVTDGNTLVITVPGADTSEARALGQTSQLLFRPVEQPLPPDSTKLMEVAGDMANRWVEAGVLTPEVAQNALTELADNLNSGIEQQTQALANDAELSDEQKQQLQDALTNTPKVEAPKVTASEPAPTKNSIEAAERRNTVIEMMRQDRQSDDATLQFAAYTLLQCNDEVDPMAGTDDPAKPFVACDPSIGRNLILGPAPLLLGQTDENGTRLTGNEIDTSRPITGGLNPQTGQREISFAFKSDGAEQGSATWANLTQEYLNRQVAITLDSKVISAPVIRGATPVGSATSITGSFTEAEAQSLANNLRYGALPLSFAGENGERGGTATTIPATLGYASLKAGLIAGIVGLILVALFALAYYRVFGVLVVTTVVAAGVLIYGALVLLGRWVGYSLDLAGIAGLIIGIGTTADSFVVFYERIKDEIRDGRTFRSAVPRAWARAKHTILSGNLVSLIAAVVLYVLAVGDVKGFAFTLGLTTIFDLVVVFLVSAPLVVMASRKPWFARPQVNGLAGVMRVAERRRSQGDYLPGDHADEPVTATAHNSKEA